jgi:hypothetical protein
MRGCELLEAYPVVPLADRHALSIGFTAIQDTACFGLYADRESLPDAALLAQDIGDAIDELLEEPGGGQPGGTGATFWPRVPAGVCPGRAARQRRSTCEPGTMSSLPSAQRTHAL